MLLKHILQGRVDRKVVIKSIVSFVTQLISPMAVLLKRSDYRFTIETDMKVWPILLLCSGKNKLIMKISGITFIKIKKVHGV